MNIVVTGAQGFIGKNLCVRLKEQGFDDLKVIDRDTTQEQVEKYLKEADFVYHLAGVNRPKDESEFKKLNSDLTSYVVSVLAKNKKKPSLVITSSIQAEKNNAYGLSKADAEKTVVSYGENTGFNYYIYRLPNVFGKWCKPNYNSFIATFCYNIANNVDININDPLAEVSLVYIDDVCDELIRLINGNKKSGYRKISPEYSVTVGQVSDLLYSFKNSRTTLAMETVGVGLVRALYSTYLTYLKPEQFSYPVPVYSDERGMFSELLKTPTSGQFSFFTAHPGITRGGHYHHTKNEKFIVVKGEALFKFENILTGERYEKKVTSNTIEVVETVPGWSHDITNIGGSELIVLLWANEVFDKEVPDTITRIL